MTTFDHAPFIVIWETTRACALACVHCRAEAIPRRDPGELTTDEGCRLIDRVPAFSARAFAATGDPLAEDPGCAYEPAGQAGASGGRQILGGSDVAPDVTPEQVTEALRAVIDPELGLSVVDLGLIYGVAIEGGAVSVTMTLTAPGCPLHGVMADWVRRAVLRMRGVKAVDVRLTFDPPWTPARILSR
jgi:metal-sulfur cluster biosynthetic enzyme